MKDWTGNKRTTFATLGASNHSMHEREQHDFYATHPSCADAVHTHGLFKKVWEPACGQGHLSLALQEMGYEVRESDLIDRGIGAEQLDFLACDTPWDGDIVTNPPYKYAQEFIEKALTLIPEGRRVFMFLKLTFLEGQARQRLFQTNPPQSVLVYAARQKCAINGKFAETGSSAACYAWFVWEKGWHGKPSIGWI